MVKNYSPLFKQLSRTQFNRRLITYQHYTCGDLTGYLQYKYAGTDEIVGWIDYRNPDGKPINWIRID